MTKYGVGRTGHPYKLKLQTGIHYKGYVPRLTLAAIQAIRNEVRKIQRANSIKTSNSPYLAPIVVVPKQDGALRVCISFHRVKLDIFNDAYPMH